MPNGVTPWCSECRADRRAVVLGEVLLFVGGLREGVCPDLRPNCSSGGQCCLQRQSPVVDDDGLLVLGSAIVKVLDDNWPMCRHFDFCLMRVRVLLPQPQMAEDAFYDVGFMNEADDFIRKNFSPDSTHTKVYLSGHGDPKSYFRWFS